MSNKKINPNIKPPKNLCPELYCFHWGKRFIFEPEQHCTAIGGCKRLRTDEIDAYDPNEPYLEKNNLPWFYFIPNPEIVPDQLRDKYIIESEKLWGKEHWKDIN